MDMYTKAYCPHCKAHMLVWLGDWSDDTNCHTDAAQCPTCEKNFLFGGEFEQRDILDEIFYMNFEFDEEEEDRQDEIKREAINILLAGKKWREMDLSEFLDKYASTQKGELLK